MRDVKKRGIVLLLMINLAVLAVFQALPAAAAYKKGSAGSVVTQIQQKLSQWGYYSGSVDGVYGSQTEKAVRQFQRKNDR